MALYFLFLFLLGIGTRPAPPAGLPWERSFFKNCSAARFFAISLVGAAPMQLSPINRHSTRHLTSPPSLICPRSEYKGVGTPLLWARARSSAEAVSSTSAGLTFFVGFPSLPFSVLCFLPLPSPDTGLFLFICAGLGDVSSFLFLGCISFFAKALQSNAPF